MTTLAEFRQDVLNVNLGLDLTLGTNGDDDEHYGSTEVRNQAIRTALQKLWPRVARLAVEDVTPSTAELEYDLELLDDVETVDLIGGRDTQPIDKGNNFRFLVITTADPDVVERRLRLPMSFTTGTFTTIRAIGYIRYTHDIFNDAASLDTPSYMDWVIAAGARAELYRMHLNSRMTYERHNVQSRDNDMTVGDMMTAYGVAVREFEDGISLHRRQFATGHSFRP